jgi:hypothetical protein
MGIAMEHFPDDQWVDFVRQVTADQQHASMKQHVDSGCVECSKAWETWRTVMQLGRREKNFEPPVWAVQAVKASFVARKAIPLARGPVEFARLLFDSAMQPAMAGVRGTASIVRQLLYRSGSMCIDMRMQPKPGSDSMVLIGQLLDSARPNQGMSGVPVSLLCNGDTVSRGKTNDVGEFDFGMTAHSQLQLVFGIGDSRTIVVPVPEGDRSAD